MSNKTIYVPKNNLLLYGKTATDRTYKAVDISQGTFVNNLLYASLVPAAKFEQLKAMADANIKYGVKSYIKETGTNKIIYKN